MKTEKKFALLRIAFGGVWTIDAYFKWLPAFRSGLLPLLNSMTQGQPMWIQSWITLWIRIISINPSLFAILIAIIETIIALSLLFGIYTRPILVASIIFSVLIWSIAEGFGGPYVAGSTDIGSAIMYAFVAIALLLGEPLKRYSISNT